MTKAQLSIAVLVSLTVGYFAGRHVGAGAEPLAVIPPEAQPDPAVERYRVPLGRSPAKGGDKAKVTIVEFSDFQCPFCSRVEATIAQIVKTYGRDVKVVWKNNPLPFHQNAMPAAQLAMAAEQKGKFWEMQEKLFKNQQALDRASLEKYGKELGLDEAAIKEALDGGKYAAAIKADQEEAATVGARGTPSFFINGRPLSGAQPLAAFTKIIDEELANAQKALHAGVAAAQVYDALTHNAKAAAVAEDSKRPQPQAPQQDNTVYKAQVGDAPVRGAKNAKVTIVEWSDYQCPFCARVEPTLSKVLDGYKSDVRVAFKQLPLPFHQNAHLAAEAALAAKAQGKFWEMHDKLFANQQSLDRASLEKYAQEIGLKMERFKSDLDHGKWKLAVDAEQAEGGKLGARGTPSFFINGKVFVGGTPTRCSRKEPRWRSFTTRS
jgi:protein-disulfide isomerase